jgi:hypothetical protein
MKKIISQLMLGLSVAACQAQDIIVFKNGEKLAGKILKQDEEHVSFQSEAFGSVELPTQSIAEIRIETPVLGNVSIPAEAIAKQAPEQPMVDQRAQPVEKTASTPQKKQGPTEKSAWSGQAGLSIALRESNSLRRRGEKLEEQNQEFESYRAYGNVKWKGKKNDLKWDWTYRYSSTDLRKNDDFLNITQNYKHNFSDKFFAGTKTLYQRDYRRGIEDEYLQTAEIGIKWFDSPTLQFSTAAGAGYHQYDRINDQYSDTEGKFVLDQALRWQMINSLTLFQKYTHLGNLDKYHFVFTSGLENKLIRDVFLRLEYRLDRDTDVNYDDKSYYDKALLTSLLYKF